MAASERVTAVVPGRRKSCCCLAFMAFVAICKEAMQHPTACSVWILLSWVACAANATSAPVEKHHTADKIVQVDSDWDLLLPPDQRSSPPEPPAPIHGYLGEASPAATQTGSRAVNKKLDGQLLRIPGFIVPLEEDSEGRVLEFFLVPYVGACIHVPPPPPNQIVYVKAGEPFFVHGLGDAYWIVGRMHTQVRETPMASASYFMTADSIEPYEYPK
jgi:hypothetical protein